MFKKSGNPKIEELTKSHKDRRINLSSIGVIKIDGLRKCVWCAEGILSHGNQKYCSTLCSSSAWAWANPQKEEGLNHLLIRQGWKCNTCQYDWRPLAEQIFIKMHSYGDGRFDGSVFGTEVEWGLMKRLKAKALKEFAPEVDHIVPIYKGGQSLGLDNHQAICYTCHKAKTKQDLKKSV